MITEEERPTYEEWQAYEEGYACGYRDGTWTTIIYMVLVLIVIAYVAIMVLL